jgi:2-polyprenyl-3-methyl-5-hydroxy-6-metoxy-1,4-benzoquinol methylase
MNCESSVKHLCECCGSKNLTFFYEVQNVPVRCNLMTSTKQEALAIPSGNILLGHCKECGFISNVAFDPAMQDFVGVYEDQQAFSPTFRSFSLDLANCLIGKYNLHGKDILEIGCGKGDFLMLLCGLGRNRGVGIDPAFSRDRIHDEAADGVTFIQDFFDEKYACYSGDFVCCRHTLEHINSPKQFLGTVRRAIGSRLDTVVFFEIPDVTRILRELAFWDIYYEHCSYFSAGSLVRLFRACGFEVIGLARAYDDQYLLIEARPVESPSNTVHELEENLEQISRDVEYFSTHVNQKLRDWAERFQEMHAQHRRVVAWGSGSKCVSFLTTFDTKNIIEYVVDINPHRHGRFIPGVGKEVKPPQFLTNYKPDTVVIMNSIYHDEIQQILKAMNVVTEITCV